MVGSEKKDEMGWGLGKGTRDLVKVSYVRQDFGYKLGIQTFYDRLESIMMKGFSFMISLQFSIACIESTLPSSFSLLAKS